MPDTTPLSELIERLHEVNRQLSEAARPLDHPADLDLEQREQLGKQIRAVLERWETLTQQIRQALAHKQEKLTP